MDARDLAMWERTKEIMSLCGCGFRLRDRIEVYEGEKAPGLTLGHFDTVREAYAFMCGYEHYASIRRPATKK